MKWKTKNQQTQGQLLLPEPRKSHQLTAQPWPWTPCQTCCHLSTLFGRTYCKFHLWNWMGWSTCFLFFQLATNFLNRGKKALRRNEQTEQIRGTRVARVWTAPRKHKGQTAEKEARSREWRRAKGQEEEKQAEQEAGFPGALGGQGLPRKNRRKQRRHCHLSTQGFSAAKKRIRPHFPYNKHSLHFQLIQQEHFWSKRREEKWKSLSRVWLFATPWTVHGVPQPRILEWVAFPFSSGSSQLKVHSCLHWRKQPSRGPGISTITNSDLERSLFNHLILLPF